MTRRPGTRRLAVVGRSTAGQPRTYRLEIVPRPGPSSDAAYRRLAAVLLGVDVPSLAHHLHQQRLALQPVAA